jgi:hypothetical protein
VERELFEPEVAEGLLEWFHLGFNVDDSVWLEQDDGARHERLARYCAGCPVSLERLEYDRESATVTYTSDKADGPTAGRHTFEATAFIARLVSRIPDKGQVIQRYYGYYANRKRGDRRSGDRRGRGLRGGGGADGRMRSYGAVERRKGDETGLRACADRPDASGLGGRVRR